MREGRAEPPKTTTSSSSSSLNLEDTMTENKASAQPISCALPRPTDPISWCLGQVRKARRGEGWKRKGNRPRTKGYGRKNIPGHPRQCVTSSGIPRARRRGVTVGVGEGRRLDGMNTWRLLTRYSLRLFAPLRRWTHLYVFSGLEGVDQVVAVAGGRLIADGNTC